MPEGKVTRRQFVQTTAAATAVVAAGAAAAEVPKSKIVNYNENMEYRLWGKAGLMISAVCLGGHWKRIDKMVPGVFKSRSWLSAKLDDNGFIKNRTDVVSRCIDVGINHIDACTIEEVRAYARAVKGRREKMHLGCSWYQRELRNGRCRTKKALLNTLDWGMKDAGLDYVDLWRITMHERSSRHTDGEVEEMMAALEAAKKAGKARFIGFSSHDRPHIAKLIKAYPDTVDAIVTPYTAKTTEAPKDSLFPVIKEHNVGFFGIKPFASNSLFKGDSSPGNPHAEEDDKRARLAIRYILCNDTITAPIPGMINTHQVDNVAKAVTEARQLNKAEAQELQDAMNEAWAKLPRDYQWLKDWECV